MPVKVEGGVEHRLGIVAVGPVIGPLPLALEAGGDGVVAYHLLLEFLGEIGVALYEILYDAVHLYGKFPLLALFLIGKPYAALLAQELHGFGIVVAALLAVLECPRQRFFIGLVVVYALLHAAEYLHLIDGFDAQAEVFLHELLVYDGAAYAHAHGAYLQIALAAHGGSRNGRPAEAQQLFLYVLRYLGDLIRVLYLMAVYAEGWKPLLGVGWASTEARYTAPGRSVPLKPHTPFIVMGSISMVSEP